MKRVGLERRGQPVVDRVLRVTVRELGRVGLARLSVPVIASKAGVNKTSVYRRWKTKQALVRAALGAQMSAPAGEVNTGSLSGDLVVLGRGAAAFVTSPMGRGVIRTALAEGRRRELVALQQGVMGGEVLEVLRRASRRGELARRADGELMLFLLGGAVLHRLLVEGAAADERWLRRVVAFLVSRSDAGARPPRRPERDGRPR